MRNLENIINNIKNRGQHKQIAILYGAGISSPSPSSIPTVSEIINRQFERLCSELPAFEDNLRESKSYYQAAPFEEFISVVRQGLLFRYDELLDEMKWGTPNNYHCFLARALVSEPVSYLLTTNFDNLVEKALGEQLNSINVSLDINQLPTSLPALAKLHGSFWGPDGSDVRATIGSTIESITRGINPVTIRNWANFLNDLLLVVIGYGGRDRHDILPILFQSNGEIIWISHEPDVDLCVENTPIENEHLSDEVRLLLQDNSNRVCLRGNTQSFLRQFGEIISIDFDEEHNWQVIPALNFNSTARDSRLFLAPLYGKYAGLVTGFLFLNISWMREASLAFNEFLQICNEDDYKLFAIGCNGLGQAFEALEDYDGAETAYKLALRGWLEVGNESIIAQTENHLGIVARKKGDFDTAYRWLNRARLRAEENKDHYSLGMTFHNLGNWYEKNGDYPHAIKFFQAALEAKQLVSDYLNQPVSIDGIILNSRLHNNSKYSEETVEWCIERLRLRWAMGHDAWSALGLNVMYENNLHELVAASLEVYGNAATLFCQENRFLTESGLIDDLYTRGLPYIEEKGRFAMFGLGKRKSKALKVLLPKEKVTPPVTTVVYDCPHCGKEFISPLVNMPVEKVVGNSLPLNCGACGKPFTLVVERSVPLETL